MVQAEAEAEAQVPQLLQRLFAFEFQQDGGTRDPDCGSSGTGNTLHVVRGLFRK